MIEKKIFSEIKFILFLIICFIALFLRIYQLNFEDYWLDEQTSFWTADPFLSLNETVKRMFSPIYILIITLITSCLIFKPSEETKYNKFRLTIFTLGIITIILAEVSPQLIKYSNVSSYLFLISPFILSLVFYFFLIIKFKFNFKKNYDH